MEVQVLTGATLRQQHNVHIKPLGPFSTQTSAQQALVLMHPSVKMPDGVQSVSEGGPLGNLGIYPFGIECTRKSYFGPPVLRSYRGFESQEIPQTSVTLTGQRDVEARGCVYQIDYGPSRTRHPPTVFVRSLPMIKSWTTGETLSLALSHKSFLVIWDNLEIEVWGRGRTPTWGLTTLKYRYGAYSHVRIIYSNSFVSWSQMRRKVGATFLVVQRWSFRI